MITSLRSLPVCVCVCNQGAYTDNSADAVDWILLLHRSCLIFSDRGEYDAAGNFQPGSNLKTIKANLNYVEAENGTLNRQRSKVRA